MTRPISSVGSVALLVLLSFVDARVSCAAATPQENRDEGAAPQPPAHSRPAAYPASRQIAFPGNGHLYQRIDVPVSWRDARRLCEEVGGHLATVTSAEENEFVLTNFASDHVCWLGATDEAEEGKWRWVTNEPFEFQNWSAGEPSNRGGIEHYMLLGNAQVATVQGRPFTHYGFGPHWNDHSLEGQYNGVPVAFPLCEWSAPPPAAAPERLLAAPDGSVADLHAFLNSLREFRPDTSRTSSQFYWQAPTAMMEAATQILQKEKDELSVAYQTALHILLEDRIGRIPLSMRTIPMDQLATIELLDMFLRAKIETQRLDREDAQLALWAARVSESTAAADQARTAFARYAQRLVGSNATGVADVAQLMEGMVRRLDSIGKPLVLHGGTADGSPLDWTAYRGKPVFVFFWRSDHAESRAIMEAARWQYDGYHERGFEVVGINLDDDPAAVNRYLQAEPIAWRTVLDATSEGAQRMSTYYGVVDLPKSFLVDAAGNVMTRDLSPDVLARILAGWLGEVPYTASLAAPPYSPQGPLRFLDVTSRANRTLTISTFAGETGNNLAELPLGEQKLGGVTYQVTDALIQLGSLYLPELARTVRGIPVGGKIRGLYFLQGTQWGADPYTVAEMTVIGEYRVHYEDGTLAKIPLRYGDSVRDWWNIDNSRETARAEVAWTGENAVSRPANVKLRLYGTGWMNPHPDKRIDHLDLASANTIAAPFCLAITAEEAVE